MLELAADGDLLPGDHQDPVAGHAALVSDRFGPASRALPNGHTALRQGCEGTWGRQASTVREERACCLRASEVVRRAVGLHDTGVQDERGSPSDRYESTFGEAPAALSNSNASALEIR